MRINAVVRQNDYEMNVSWKDGKLSGDEYALALLAIVDWESVTPFPAGEPQSIENPYAFLGGIGATFDEVVSVKAEPELEPLVGDVLPPTDGWKPPRLPSSLTGDDPIYQRIDEPGRSTRP